MINPQTVDCYAVRRLNPFLGVMHVLETLRGRASTTNGVVWHLELLAKKPAAWGSLNTDTEERGWYLYGLWSENEGLVNVPQARLHAGRTEAAICEYLIETVKTHRSALPFPLRDHSELWLLDEVEKKPLALLFSILPDASPPRPQPHYWCGSWHSDDLVGQRRFPEIEWLEAAVRERAGFNRSTLWLTRDPTWTQAYTADGRVFERAALPVYGVSEEWPSEHDSALVARYIDWIAPSLLTLSYLQDDERDRLESSLQQQATSIEYHWRLFPKILDEKKLTAARVQARLQSGESK